MNRVLTTSTGEATTVVQKPAPKAAVKWHGRLSDGKKCHMLRWDFLIACESSFTCISPRLTCHEVVLKDELFNNVIGDELCTVHNGITGDVRHTT